MLKKTARVLVPVVAVLLLLLVLFPLVFRKLISDEVRNLLNENYNAKIDYADLSFSLLKHFPNPTVSLEKFVAVGKDEFDGDTLASFQKLEVSFGWLSLFKGSNYNIQSISVIEPVVKLRVNKSGKANWDIAKELFISKDTLYIAKEGKQSFTIEVKKWSINHGSVSYKNDTVNFTSALKNLNVEGTRVESNNGFGIKSIVSVDDLTSTYKGLDYLQGLHLKAEQNYTYKADENLYEIKDNHFQLNDLQLLVNGSIKADIGKGPYVLLSVAGMDSSVKNLLSLFSIFYESNFAQLKATGTANVRADIKGYFKADQYPALQMYAEIKDASIQKQGIPARLENMCVRLDIDKPEGLLNAVVIQVSKFHIESGNDSMNASIKIVTPVSDANVSFHINGNAELQALAAFMPGRDSSGISGKAAVNATLKFRQSDINNKAYKNIVTEGNLDLQNLIYSGSGFSAPINIKEARFSCHPEFVSLERVDLSIAKNKVGGNGKIGNAIPYLMHAGNLNVALNLQSEELNLHDLIVKAPEPKVVKNVSPVKPLAVDRKGEKHDVLLTINAAIKKLYYDKLLLQNLKGQLTLNADTIRIKDLHAELLGGNAVLSSEYINAGDGKPDFNFHSNVSNINLKQLYAVMDNAEKVAPSLKYISGNFSGEVKGKGKLKADKTVNYSALNADGNLQIATLKIDELPTLTQIGKLAKVKSLDHLEAKNVQSIFHFKSGQTEFEPTECKFTNGYRIAFHGTHYPNQTVNADVGLDVPVKEFGSIANMAQNLLSGFINIPQSVHFDFKLTGNDQHPDIKLAGVNTAGN